MRFRPGFDSRRLHHYTMSIGPNTRTRVLQLANERCEACGRADVPLTMDHIHPRSKGGGKHWTNLMALCTRCQMIKGSRTLDEFGAWLDHDAFGAGTLRQRLRATGRWKYALRMTLRVTVAEQLRAKTG